MGGHVTEITKASVIYTDGEYVLGDTFRIQKREAARASLLLVDVNQITIGFHHRRNLVVEVVPREVELR